MDFANKTIAVTGGLGALGRATVSALRARGARVVVLDFAPAAELGEGITVVGGVDVAEPQAVAAALRQALGEGELHGLVNIAGGFAWETLEGGALDTWDMLYRRNLRSAVASCQAALPHLREGSRIVNVGALGAVKAGAGMGAYAASKAGVMRFTEALAEELKDRGITVNAVLPSIIDTPANRADMPSADFSRWVSPQALSDVIGFLLSPAASAVTGALIPVPGRV
ncbi:MAG TPA: SDR family oxidoreductase [Arenimonas sp.]|nr:SDR family oxidoreductase [Arenimonas sp.]